MSNSNTYNGHPTYDHWNVALWVSSTEDWYRDATTLDVDTFAYIYEGVQTDDGVTMTRDLLAYAWRCLNE